MNRKQFSKQFVLILVLVLFCSFIVQAQKSPVSQEDQIRIIENILKNYEYHIFAKTWKSGNENTIYLLAENVPLKKIPRINGIKIVPVNEKEVEQMSKKGIEYYRFGKFQVADDWLGVEFHRIYITPEIFDGNSAVYKCEKFFWKWRTRGQTYSVFTLPAN